MPLPHEPHLPQKCTFPSFFRFDFRCTVRRQVPLQTIFAPAICQGMLFPLLHSHRGHRILFEIQRFSLPHTPRKNGLPLPYNHSAYCVYIQKIHYQDRTSLQWFCIRFLRIFSHFQILLLIFSRFPRSSHRFFCLICNLFFELNVSEYVQILPGKQAYPALVYELRIYR